MLNELMTELKRDEGRRDRPYKDTRGILTIGYGHNLMASGLCEAALSAQLDHDIHLVFSALDQRLPWWRKHPEPVQRVLANLCFNLGIDGLLKFKKTLPLIMAREYVAAADALMENGTYINQVGDRVGRLANLLRSCYNEASKGA